MPADIFLAPERKLTMLRGFVRMPWRDKAALILAWVLLGCAAALLHLVPFKRIAGWLGTPTGTSSYVPAASPRQASRAMLVGRAIARAVRIAPFRADCLPQALAAAWMCRVLSVPFAVHIGARLDEARSFEAHAWTIVGDVAVTGGRQSSEHAILASFLSPRAGQPDLSS